MSFMDTQWELWDAQALTASEESRTNGNMFDLETDGAPDSQTGFLWWNMIVSTAEDGTMTSGGYFQIVTSDTVTFDAGSGAEQVVAAFGSADLPLFAAQLIAGARFSLAFPTRILHKYLEAEFRVVTQSAGALVVDSWFGLEPLSDLNIQKEPT